MNPSNGSSISPWLDSGGMPEFAPLAGDVHTQV